jgi:hypothetical protein
MSENAPFSIDAPQSIHVMPHVSSVSTSMEPSSTSLHSTFVDATYVSHTSYSHGDDMGFTIPSSITSSSSITSHIPIFHFDEYILESLTALYYLWDDMQHHSYFLLKQPSPSNQYVVESNDFIPHGKIYWFKNFILSPCGSLT